MKATRPHEGCETQRHRDTEAQRHRGTEAQRHRHRQQTQTQARSLKGLARPRRVGSSTWHGAIRARARVWTAQGQLDERSAQRLDSAPRFSPSIQPLDERSTHHGDRPRDDRFVSSRASFGVALRSMLVDVSRSDAARTLRPVPVRYRVRRRRLLGSAAALCANACSVGCDECEVRGVPPRGVRGGSRDSSSAIPYV